MVGRAISIHALLAESDSVRVNSMLTLIQFLSTLSLRRATLAGPSGPAFLYNFYPRSPCGERPITITITCTVSRFLSTLSLRRATVLLGGFQNVTSYFYPRSPCGERRSIQCYPDLQKDYFYPRSPCGERPKRNQDKRGQIQISIHALLAESDVDKVSPILSTREFLSTLSLRRAT